MKKHVLYFGLLVAFLFNSILSFSREKYLPLSINYHVTHVSCYGKNDGKIEIEVTGGKAPYIIIWDNGLSELIHENLRKGDYSVKVCDARGKSKVLEVCIDSPEPLTINLSSEASMNLDFVSGKANLSVEGGTPWIIENTELYFFRLNGESNFANPEELENNNYILSVEDAKGCASSKNVYVMFKRESQEELSLINNSNEDVLIISQVNNFDFMKNDRTDQAYEPKNGDLQSNGLISQ